MLAKAGEENAGLVDIGDGLACSFKIESHNHPSAIEPYQGAATGVGGINRDIFTMGARPVAQLNSLRFGNIHLDKTKWLVKGVVKGIGDYGNAFGIPTVGGEVFFDECYNVNPLVNAFSAGIVKVGESVSAIAKGEGNPVFIVGSATGKDGIQGASFASKDITEDSANDLPSVQVGDPFQEKLLLEATLEVIRTGKVVGIQDMGAAGIICSTSEMSEKGDSGMIINLDKVPTRQDDMLPFEMLLSESQERMLVVAEKGSESEVKAVFDKWDLNCEQIGHVTDDPMLKFYWHGELVAEMPAASLVLGGGAPVYEREYREPEYYSRYKKFNPQDIPVPDNLKEVATHLLSHPNLASKKWVSQQYDSMVGTDNTVVNDATSAPVVRIKGTQKGLSMTVDCNSRYVNADPEEGTAIAVAEAARNITCSGGEPVAVTNCLNFGNPYVPEVYWQFVGAIKGMSKACIKFNTPVTGGNVSFYNQSADGGPVFPTPTIGMIGLLENINEKMSISFKSAGDAIYIIGPVTEDIASSQYLYSFHNKKESPSPFFDIDVEYDVQQMTRTLIREKLVRSANDVSDGGLFLTLAECGMAGKLGFDIHLPAGFRSDSFLYGEGQSRVVLTVSEKDREAFEDKLEANGTDYLHIGNVAPAEEGFSVDGQKWFTMEKAVELYEGVIPGMIDAQ